MNDQTLAALTVSAAVVGFVHTLAGPDHYIPFIAMSRARRWSLRKTITITMACGIGHVTSSAMIGTVGMGLGWALDGQKWFEAARACLASWLLLGFGIAYCVWGFHHARQNRPVAHRHRHAHAFADDLEDTRLPGDTGGEDASPSADAQRTLTPWILFTIFVFGPCEPLLPLLMYPAAVLNGWGVFLVTVVFGVVTLGAMAGAVAAGWLGFSLVPVKVAERYAHALSGLAVIGCGLAIRLGF